MATFTTAELIESVIRRLRELDDIGDEQMTMKQMREYIALTEELDILRNTRRTFWKLKEDL